MMVLLDRTKTVEASQTRIPMRLTVVGIAFYDAMRTKIRSLSVPLCVLVDSPVVSPDTRYVKQTDILVVLAEMFSQDLYHIDWNKHDEP